MNVPTEKEVLTAKERLDLLRAHVHNVYIGHAEVVQSMLITLLARGHALLEGVPGVAKTTLVKTFAASLGVSVRRIQFTPDLLPADILGTYVLTPKDGTFSLRPGPIFANIVLADEINRAPAKTQSALLEAMQEHQVTIEGDRFELKPPFVVLATQNPVDLQGTYPLPEAQIDRFLLRISMGYPTPPQEISMLRSQTKGRFEVTAILHEHEVLWLQQLTSSVHVEEDLLDYAVRLVSYTRSHPKIVLGASPRATLGLVQAAKACALLAGRNFATPDDIRAVALPVLAHRLVLSPEVESSAKAQEAFVREAIQKIGYQRPVQA